MENTVHVIEESEQDQTADDKDTFIIVESENIQPTMVKCKILFYSVNI